MESNTNTQKINILNILRIFLRYWPLLLISSFISVAIGVLYLKFASKTYSVFSSIVINTEQASGPRGADMYVNVNDLMNQQKSFANEVTYLKSTPLIKEVIKDMQLTTSYYIQEDVIPKELVFSLQNIYKNSPFFVIFDEGSPQPLNTLFYIQILNEKSFELYAYQEYAYLYNFKDEVFMYEFPFYISGKFNFGEVIKNNYCSFKILLNSNYDPEQYINKDMFFKFNSAQTLAFQFQEALDISSAFYESSIANLTFKWENLDLAMEFLTQLINKYIDKNLEKKNLNANKTIEYIEQQLANIQGSLGQSENRLQSFRTSRDVLNINQKTDNLYTQIQDIERSRDEIQTRYQNLSSLKNYFEENKNSSTFIVPSSLGMSDASLATLIQELTALSREKQELINTDQLRNPRIKTLEANIATIKKVITDNISFNLLTTQNELNELNNRLSALNTEYTLLPQTQRQLQELERDFNINDEVYSSLLNQRIQAKIMKASNRPDVEIIEPVRYMDITSPNPKKIGMISLFLGLFFPSIYIIIVNFLTQKIQTVEELSKYCKIPSVGTILHNDNSYLDLIFKFPQSPIVERFHTLRSNILYYHKEPHKNILITSTIPDEGKSFISLNIALSFASANFKTLLVAFDLRKNSKTFRDLDLKPLAGLDLFLMNKANLEDIILKTPYPNLDFISNGKIPTDPSNLISSPRIAELFDALKYEYDYIIIDTPPIGMVSDAIMLMQYADIKLYVSRLGTVTKKALKNCMEDLLSKKIQDIYLIKNDIAKLDTTYTDKYSYAEPKKRNFFSFLRSKKVLKKMQ